jgi:hypothetical protein
LLLLDLGLLARQAFYIDPHIRKAVEFFGQRFLEKDLLGKKRFVSRSQPLHFLSDVNEIKSASEPLRPVALAFYLRSARISAFLLPVPGSSPKIPFSVNQENIILIATICCLMVGCEA